jgi:outer membrane receptor protein involved in Fe transport
MLKRAVKMEYFLKVLITGTTALITTILAAETIELKGKVRHANTFLEISNVNIYIEGTKTGTSSAVDGTFTLLIPDPVQKRMIVFEHVAFDTLRLSLPEAMIRSDFYLSPRIIALPEILVQAQREQPEIARDIPQRLAIVEAKYFGIQGYVDAGDLLNTQQSIQINEDISGEKNISIRAGNPEDVIVMYNGIKLNDLYDNTYDLAQMNLEDIGQIEIIKGSNTALYGPEAFSGVINFVPKTFRNYTARFTQRFGTYDAGDWNLQLNRTFANKLNVCYTVKKGNLRRKYTDAPGDSAYLQNKILYHSANISYYFSENKDKNRINSGYFYSSSSFDDNRYDDKLSRLNRVISLQYDGDLGFIPNVNMAGSYQTFDKDEKLTSQNGALNRSFQNHKIDLHLEKRFTIRTLEMLLAYQYEKTELKYKEQATDPLAGPAGDIQPTRYNSIRQGLVSIIKIHTPTGSGVLHTADFDLSLRYDRVHNRPADAGSFITDDNSAVLQKTDWTEPTVKFSTFLSGNQRFYKFSTFINFGTNIKFPTLFQQLSTPQVLDPDLPGAAAVLKPEKNRSLEIGFDVTRELAVTSTLEGWQITGSFFTNYYENKFRTYYVPGLSTAFFDNVSNADISGFEGQLNTFFIRRKLKLELGASNYKISDKTAFPFKSDTKFFTTLVIDHHGYSLQLYWFNQSEQSGWIRDREGKLSELTLPAEQNIDIHLGKIFEIYKFKLFTSFSIRNLLNDPAQLTGIAIRDRRYYLSFGLEY